MKLSKKLLTALLPISATVTVAPILASCNKSSYTINFGDEINCLDEKAKNYHSINDVKNAVKEHASVEQVSEIKEADLVKITATSLGKQLIYYDLVASLAIKSEFKFHLTYDKTTNVATVKYVNKEGKTLTPTGVELSYAVNKDAEGAEGPWTIYINVGKIDGNNTLIPSYTYHNTKAVKGE